MGGQEDAEKRVKKSTDGIALWTHRPLPPDEKLPAKVNLEDVISQKDDRLLMDTLLESSEEGVEDTSQLIGTLFCGDWRDAVTGWSLTQPNVKYAWLDKSPKKPEQERKPRRDATYLSKKKQQQQQRQYEVEERERSWRTKVEPGTYRYNPDFGVQCRPDHILLQKRLVHPALQHHIDKVREHLEKTLMKQVNGDSFHERLQPLPGIHVEHKEPLPGMDHAEDVPPGDEDLPLPVSKLNGHKHGQYVAILADRGRRHSDVDQIDDHEIGGKGDAGFHRNGYGRQSDTKLSIRNQRNHHHINRQQQNQTHDLVTALGQKLNEILMEDALKTPHGLANLSLSRKVQKASLYNSPATNSYERFPTTSISPTPLQADPQPGLNPLTKVTPHQRHVHDNNEIIAITSDDKVTSSKTSTAQSSTGSIGLGAPFETDVILMERTPNKDFIEIGISGQRLQSAKSIMEGELPHNQPLKQHLSSGGRFHKLPLTHGKTHHGRSSGSAADKDEMHRGIIDREAAAAIATALMPGVSGRKIEAAPTA